jgi:transposase-like protein
MRTPVHARLRVVTSAIRHVPCCFDNIPSDFNAPISRCTLWRMWWNRFGPMFAGDIRRQRIPRMRGFRHWRWHLDEMYVKLNGEMVYLWRAVDHEGEILESYITRTRDKDAACAS